jgi:hypothetical protein
MRLASPADEALPARCRETRRFRLREALQVMENPGRSGQPQNGMPTMKRSRRVVLTMMGSAAAGVVSMGLVPRVDCGPGNTVLPGPDGKPYCRPAYYGGFGGTRFHGYGHGGHGHAGG